MPNYKIKEAVGVMPGYVLDVERGCYIPMNPENKDFQRYLEWVAEGNEPEVIET